MIFLAWYFGHKELDQGPPISKSYEFTFQIMNTDYLDSHEWRKHVRIVKTKIDFTDYIFRSCGLNNDTALKLAYSYSKDLIKMNLRDGILHDKHEFVVDENSICQNYQEMILNTKRITKRFTIR